MMNFPKKIRPPVPLVRGRKPNVPPSPRFEASRPEGQSSARHVTDAEMINRQNYVNFLERERQKKEAELAKLSEQVASTQARVAALQSDIATRKTNLDKYTREEMSNLDRKSAYLDERTTSLDAKAAKLKEAEATIGTRSASIHEQETKMYAREVYLLKTEQSVLREREMLKKLVKLRGQQSEVFDAFIVKIVKDEASFAAFLKSLPNHGRAQSPPSQPQSHLPLVPSAPFDGPLDHLEGTVDESAVHELKTATFENYRSDYGFSPMRPEKIVPSHFDKHREQLVRAARMTSPIDRHTEEEKMQAVAAELEAKLGKEVFVMQTQAPSIPKTHSNRPLTKAPREFVAMSRPVGISRRTRPHTTDDRSPSPEVTEW
jgi:hypothetical protein